MKKKKKKKKRKKKITANLLTETFFIAALLVFEVVHISSATTIVECLAPTDSRIKVISWDESFAQTSIRRKETYAGQL